MNLPSEASPSPEHPVPSQRVICGFWVRLVAFAIDGLVLGLAGIALGCIFFEPFAHLGGWGRLIGFGVSLAYFGLLNSSVGNGQTLGQRLLKIKVVDRTGACVGLGRSLLRSAVLATPIFLNGAPIPEEMAASAVGYVVSVLLFGLGGAIVYLYLFNRRTRQSLHDLIAGTFVVQRDPGQALAGVSIWRAHLTIVGLWFLATIGLTAAGSSLAKKGPFPGLMATLRAIRASDHVRTAAAFTGRNWTLNNGERREASSFQATVTWKERPQDYQAAAAEIAKIVFGTYPQVMEKDQIVVNVSYGYDIGIAHAWTSRSFHGSPQEWQRILHLSP